MSAIMIQWAWRLQAQQSQISSLQLSLQCWYLQGIYDGFQSNPSRSPAMPSGILPLMHQSIQSTKRLYMRSLDTRKMSSPAEGC